MRLFIAEKPELAKAIVEGLGGGHRKDGYYDCGTDYVTWCFGHMLQLFDPEEYDERYAKWNMDDLPIYHIPWKKKPSKDKKAQLSIIMSLLKQADSVVHAGDPDDEGQLLIDEVIAYANCSLPIQRLLINDNNTKIVRKALDNLRSNKEFFGLSSAAEARSVGDQLYGYNLTRAYTLSARQAGYQGVLSVGRVQTPILGLVVRRDRAYATHTKSFYYNVIGKFHIDNLDFPARYQIVDGDPIDEKGRLNDQRYAQYIADRVKNQEAYIVSAETIQKEQAAPLLYNLLKLQTDASRKYGLKPDKVKAITQTLREKYRLITYNRSDCEYLSDEQHCDAPSVLSAIAKTAPNLSQVISKADSTIKSRAFNSSKVSAHHAIIPTETSIELSTLTEDEQKIYLLIARIYVAQFWPKHLYNQTTIVVNVNQHHFIARSNITTQSGWKILYANEVEDDKVEGDENDITLDIRELTAQQAGNCKEASAEKMETKPQPLYTMATLLTDLTRVAKYVRDDRLKQLLIEKDKGKAGEHGGIGTPATRDSIINTLFERGYLMEKGKNIVSTQTGQDFYDVLPDQAKYPDMTALWHEQQQSIRANKYDVDSFIQELITYITGQVEAVKQAGIGMKAQGEHTCPKCQKPLRRIKGSKGFFWGCVGYGEGCKFSCDDKRGKPAPRELPTISETNTCAVCGKGLIRFPSRKNGAFWWGCSGFPRCKQTSLDSKGQPIYKKQGAINE